LANWIVAEPETTLPTPRWALAKVELVEISTPRAVSAALPAESRLKLTLAVVAVIDPTASPERTGGVGVGARVLKEPVAPREVPEAFVA
jgi:hypothetical protein